MELEGIRTLAVVGAIALGTIFPAVSIGWIGSTALKSGGCFKNSDSHDFGNRFCRGYRYLRFGYRLDCKVRCLISALMMRPDRHRDAY